MRVNDDVCKYFNGALSFLFFFTFSSLLFSSFFLRGMKRLLQASDAAEKCQSVYLSWKIRDISAAVPEPQEGPFGN